MRGSGGRPRANSLPAPGLAALGMQAAFLGTAFTWTDVLVVAAWGVGGLLAAVRFFSWEPRQG